MNIDRDKIEVTTPQIAQSRAGEAGANLTDVLERLDGAVWSYIYHQHWALVAADGELLVEIKGEFPGGVYGYNGKRYASDTQAKAAAMRDLRSNAELET